MEAKLAKANDMSLVVWLVRLCSDESKHTHVWYWSKDKGLKSCQTWRHGELPGGLIFATPEAVFFPTSNFTVKGWLTCMLKYAWKCTYFKDQSRFGRLTVMCVVFAVMTGRLVLHSFSFFSLSFWLLLLTSTAVHDSLTLKLLFFLFFFFYGGSTVKIWTFSFI